MRRSIFLKAFGSYVFLLGALAALFLLFSFGTIKKHYLETLAGNLENLTRILEARVLAYLDEGRLDNMDAFLKQQGKEIKARITVVNPEGVVLADSEEDPQAMESHRFRPEIYEALQGRSGWSLRYSSTVKEEMLYIALPLEEEGEIVGALRVSLFIKDVNVLLSALKTDIGRAVLIIIVVSLLAAFVFAKNLTRPLRVLAKASERVAAGDFDVKVRLRSRDEWQDFANSFNAMTEELKTLFADLKNKKEELANIMASMQEGLLVLDRSDKIVLINESAKKIIQQEALEGKFYWEVIRATPFVELVRKAKEQRSNFLEEISLGERNFLCRTSYLPSQERIVITLHDITDIQNLAKMKKDLVLNASHELRTPLTAIKGFAETLEAEVEEKNKNFARTILRNTDRLIRIVEDLLVLSELEEKGARLEMEEVNLEELAKNVLRIFEPRAKEKSLALRWESDPSLPLLKADPFRLEQILINLVDNAVKYTEKGEICLSLRKIEAGLAVEIRDTGIGIPEESQSRIFERFYVVDKSRSRRLGGTGLGLSIVKHIVALHGGKIELESKPGVGTKFTVILPLARS